jgi:hemerythrin
MGTISWSDDFRIGEPKIDMQHEQLFQLAATAAKAADKAAQTSAAMLLYRYVREHFQHEEAVMRDSHFPHYTSHVKLHEEIIEGLNSISADIAAGRLHSQRLPTFMNTWLVSHILQHDNLLAGHLRRQRHAGAQSSGQ